MPDFSLSVNLIRDRDRPLNYFKTPNGERIAGQIAADFEQGQRVFNLIGSYGTGKSAFLWAFSQSLRGQKTFFDLGILVGQNVEVIDLIGEFRAATNFFSQKIKPGEAAALPFENLFAEIFHRYHLLNKKGDGLLVLLVDEFGKLLEWAARHSPEQELYFLQQLAEFIGNPAHRILLVTALHQNFEAYANALNQPQRQEWAKVKGRFREIPFNEPVEQLLFLAAESLAQKPLWEVQLSKEAAKVFAEKCRASAKLFAESGAFPTKEPSELAEKLFPLDLFSASCLTLALQKYGQNERSLFSFLEGEDNTGIRQFDRRDNLFFNLANVHDYLAFNFGAWLSSPQNTDRLTWAAIRSSLERIENEIAPEQQADCRKLVKTVGMLQLFAAGGSKLGVDFLLEYDELCLSVDKAGQAIALLERYKIFLFRKYANRFVLFEGTDVDIDRELLTAADRVEDISDMATLLNRSFHFEPVFTKEHFFKTGTPRVFDFKIASLPQKPLVPTGDIDGFVQLLFNDQLTEKAVAEVSLEQKEAVLYGFFKNSKVIRQQLFEIERTKKAIEHVPSEDKVARRELSSIQKHHENLLAHFIYGNLFEPKSEVVWFFQGRRIQLESHRAFNALLSEICRAIYPDAPVFKNELVNRTKLSSQIHTARRAFLKNMVGAWLSPEMGFEGEKFPPEKTIYLSLLKENGLRPDPQNLAALPKITAESSFRPLWDFCGNFLAESKTGRRRLSELTDALARRPFKLKQGLIDFWLPTFLFLKKDEFALFGTAGYIPTISDDSLELVIKTPSDFEVKAFDIAGIRLEVFQAYRRFLSQSEAERPGNETFIETIKPFLSFYRGLPDYARNTKRLQKESLAVREAIAKSKDPEKTFFEDLPAALGCSLADLKRSPEAVEAFSERLQEAVREIRACFGALVGRFEAFVQEAVFYENLTFVECQNRFRERFGGIPQHRLLPHHKTLLQRVFSELDDREAWFGSVAQAVAGKPLHQFRDDDEPLLFDRLKQWVMELDNLALLANSGANEEKEEVFGLEITSFEDIEKKIVRFPKKKKAEIGRIENQLRKHLVDDKTLNIAALAGVLKELLKK